MKRKNQKILTPLVSLDTPGKATVQVVILADPVSITQEGTGYTTGFFYSVFLPNSFCLYWCRMDMKFALWGMKHFENFLRWIQREANCWMTWVSFLNFYHHGPKGVALSVYGEGPKQQGPVFTIRTISFCGRGDFWARDLCLHCHLYGSYLGTALVPRHYPRLPWGATAAVSIIILLRERNAWTPSLLTSSALLVIGSSFYSIILFLSSDLFSSANKLQDLPVLKKPIIKTYYLPHIYPPPDFFLTICLHTVSTSFLAFTLQSLLHWFLSLGEMLIVTSSMTFILPNSETTFLSPSNSVFQQHLNHCSLLCPSF